MTRVHVADLTIAAALGSIVLAGIVCVWLSPSPPAPSPSVPPPVEPPAPPPPVRVVPPIPPPPPTDATDDDVRAYRRALVRHQVIARGGAHTADCAYWVDLDALERDDGTWTWEAPEASDAVTQLTAAWRPAAGREGPEVDVLVSRYRHRERRPDGRYVVYSLTLSHIGEAVYVAEAKSLVDSVRREWLKSRDAVDRRSRLRGYRTGPARWWATAAAGWPESVRCEWFAWTHGAESGFTWIVRITYRGPGVLEPPTPLQGHEFVGALREVDRRLMGRMEGWGR